MAACLLRAERPGVSPAELIDIDRECHEIIWAAAENRFLTDTLDMLYAQSDRLWHMYLADVADMLHAVDEHRPILDALVDGDGDLRRRARRGPRPLLRPTDPRRRHPPPRPTPRRHLKPLRSVCFRLPVGSSEADSSGCDLGAGEVLDVLEAEAAFDAEVAVGDGVVGGRHHLDDRVVLDVQRQRAADPAIGADRVGDWPDVASSQVPASRIWCSDENIRAPVGQTWMQLPQ